MTAPRRSQASGTAKQCKEQGCPNLTYPPSDYCSAHRAEFRAERDATIDRLSAALAPPSSPTPLATAQWTPPPPKKKSVGAEWPSALAGFVVIVGVVVFLLYLLFRGHDAKSTDAGGGAPVNPG